MNIDVRKRLLHKLLLIREFENTLSSHKMQNDIYGMVHCAHGQEAIAVGICDVLEPLDYIVSNHRPHAHAIAKGVDVKYIMAEVYGKETGTNGGKGGSMHIMDPSKGMLISTGIGGSGIPVACGVAFSAKYYGNNKITCVFMGDGSANEGVFYESLNLAAKWSLPIIFVIEDNGLAVTTYTDDTSACRDYIQLANAFGIEGKKINGQDVEDVYHLAERIVEKVRIEKRPYLIQAKTYRFHEHAEGKYYLEKRTRYRNVDKLNEEEREQCPIKRYKALLMEQGLLSEDMYLKMQADVHAEVKAAMEFAVTSPQVNSKHAFMDVYVEES